MSYLDGGKVIDLMFGLPDPAGLHAAYESFKPLYRDRESREFAFPAQYMFRDIPDIEAIGDDFGPEALNDYAAAAHVGIVAAAVDGAGPQAGRAGAPLRLPALTIDDAAAGTSLRFVPAPK